ncbi:hypothetical protein AB0M35_14380 [Micromonospora sp. NPDC051196]|uniref:hypothetical protein n=1 Tax=Micromonospora sp. NPDC051196 TaxID=3155281 RepID=UPI00342A008D
MSNENFDFGGCLIALVVVMALIGCLFMVMDKLFGSAGESMGYAVLAAILLVAIRQFFRSVNRKR